MPGFNPLKPGLYSHKIAALFFIFPSNSLQDQMIQVV